MKKLFIYYSLSGNGDVVANYLENKGFEIRKVTTKRKYPNNNILRILMGGFLAGINYKDVLVNFNSDIENYDEIFIGSPVWNGKLVPAINTVLNIINIKNKNINFIIYSGSGNITKLENSLKSKYSTAKIISLILPKENNKELDKLANI